MRLLQACTQLCPHHLPTACIRHFAMRIFVSPCEPFRFDGFTMDVKGSYTVGRVKVMIWERGDVHPNMQDLSCRGLMSDDDVTLSDYSVQSGDVLRLSLKPPLIANADSDDELQ